MLDRPTPAEPATDIAQAHEEALAFNAYCARTTRRAEQAVHVIVAVTLGLCVGVPLILHLLEAYACTAP